MLARDAVAHKSARSSALREVSTLYICVTITLYLTSNNLTYVYGIYDRLVGEPLPMAVRYRR